MSQCKKTQKWRKDICVSIMLNKWLMNDLINAL